jgi:hypothetical protein
MTFQTGIPEDKGFRKKTQQENKKVWDNVPLSEYRQLLPLKNSNSSH